MENNLYLHVSGTAYQGGFPGLATRGGYSAMAMVCPQCNRAFAQQLTCPECGGRLLFQTHARSLSREDGAAGDPAQWPQTPWGRLAVGLILAQGLAYGLQQLVTAGFLASGEQATIWTSLWGVVLLQGLQGTCVLIGGSLCGAGKKRGILYGSLVGLMSGLIFLALQRPSDDMPTAIVLYGQPILHMAFGALGGLIGTLIWKPVATLQVPEGAPGTKPVTVPAPTWQFLAGPIYPGRVCLGIFVVVNGVVWSTGNQVTFASAARRMGSLRLGHACRRRFGRLQHLQRPQARLVRRRGL
jgi:hypothetical protein